MSATEFWKGDFGDEYAARNKGRVQANRAFFLKATRVLMPPKHALEFGCGVGENLQALKILYPYVNLYGVEVNAYAAAQCKVGRIYTKSILEFNKPRQITFDLVFTKGVLIHVPPEDLAATYAKMAECADKYVLIAEYYNPKPVEVEYRGHAGRLWKRDFAGEFMVVHPEFKLIDYGFVSKYDAYPQDDITWFLMQRLP